MFNYWEGEKERGRGCTPQALPPTARAETTEEDCGVVKENEDGEESEGAGRREEELLIPKGPIPLREQRNDLQIRESQISTCSLTACGAEESSWITRGLNPLPAFDTRFPVPIAA